VRSNAERHGLAKQCNLETLHTLLQLWNKLIWYTKKTFFEAFTSNQTTPWPRNRPVSTAGMVQGNATPNFLRLPNFVVSRKFFIQFVLNIIKTKIFPLKNVFSPPQTSTHGYGPAWKLVRRLSSGVRL